MLTVSMPSVTINGNKSAINTNVCQKKEMS